MATAPRPTDPLFATLSPFASHPRHSGESRNPEAPVDLCHSEGAQRLKHVLSETEGNLPPVQRKPAHPQPVGAVHEPPSLALCHSERSKESTYLMPDVLVPSPLASHPRHSERSEESGLSLPTSHLSSQTVRAKSPRPPFK